MTTPTTNRPDYDIVFIIGAPGSGKSTTCKTAAKLTEYPYQMMHLSVGDYLRELCKPETPCGVADVPRDMIRTYLDENRLLPADIIIPLLKDKMDSTPYKRGTIWLIDGFPRDMETALAFEEQIGKPRKVIVMSCPVSIAQARFLKRARESDDNRRRFLRRYDEYAANLKKIKGKYVNVMDEVSANEDPQKCAESFIKFMAGVSRAGKA